MKQTIDFDIILNKIGPLGPYQRWVLLIILVLAPSTAVHNIASVFYSAHEDFRYNLLWIVIVKLLNFLKLKYEILYIIFN